MTQDNRQIVDSVIEALSNDETISAYVKSFSCGDADAAKRLFPYITVANMRYVMVPFDSAADIYTYTMDLVAATRSLASGTAYQGNASTGKKGIIQLCEDIVSVVRTNTFSGVFTKPISVVRYRIEEAKGSGGIIWRAFVQFEGDRYTYR